MQKIKKYSYLFLIALCSFSFVTLCSRCSFFYPFQDWVDANCFFTVGKSMANGKVLYRDIFEQKGLYLYCIHTLGYLVSRTTFIGVYLFELLFSFFFGTTLYHTLRLYIKNDLVIACAVPFLYGAIYTARAFALGDSAEEYIFCLSLIPIYFLLQSVKEEKPLSFGNTVVVGILCAFAFFVKYTMVGLFGAYLLLLLFWDIRAKDKKSVFSHIGQYALGFLIGSLPAIFYFSITHSFEDFFTVYLYENIFVYRTEGNFFLNFIGSYGAGLYFGIVPSVLTIVGFVFLFLDKRISEKEKTVLLTSYLISTVCICISGKKFEYYHLPLAVFSFLSVLPFRFLKTEGKAVFRFLSSLLMIGCGVLFFVKCNPHARGLFKEKEELYQYQFAEVMEVDENTTLLNYGWLDMGLYTVTDITPNCRYFCWVNMDLPEMEQTQNDYIKNGRCTYVCCDTARRTYPDFIFEKYQIVSRSGSCVLFELKEKQ